MALNASNKLRTRPGRAPAGGAWAALAANLTSSEPPTCYARASACDCVLADSGNRMQYLRRKLRRRLGCLEEPEGHGNGHRVLHRALNGRPAPASFRGPIGTLRRINFNGTKWGTWENLGGALYSGPVLSMVQQRAAALLRH